MISFSKLHLQSGVSFFSFDECKASLANLLGMSCKKRKVLKKSLSWRSFDNGETNQKG